MSSLQSLREFISERLAAAAEEIFRHCEGTIVQYEEELCRQRRLLDITWKPQLQLHHIDLPQYFLTNQDKNFHGKQEDQEESEPPQMKEEQEEQEPPQIKKEVEALCISQNEEQLDLKQETFSSLEIPTYEENELNKVDLNNQQSFNITDSQDEEGSRHEEPRSTTDEESVSKNRDQWKRRDRSHVQSVASSQMLKSQCDASRKVKKYFCKECGRYFTTAQSLKYHMPFHREEKPFSCKDCSKSFRCISNLKRHMIIHTEGKPFSCKECTKYFNCKSNLKRHMQIHTGEMPFSCKEGSKPIRCKFNLKCHMLTHTQKAGKAKHNRKNIPAPPNSKE